MLHSLLSLSLSALFAAAPLQVIPLLTESDRLDLIDLYEAGMTAQVTNRYGGTSEMTMLSDTLVAVRMTDVSTLELRLKEDSLIEVKHTVTLPEQSYSTVRLYTTEWELI